MDQAYLAGFIWGGLTYGILTLPFMTGSLWQGGGVMLVFGMDTLPVLLALSTLTRGVVFNLRHLVLQQMMGGLMILMGGYMASG